MLINLNVILDRADRGYIGFNVSQSYDAIEATWALEDFLLNRFGALPRADTGVFLRTDNPSVNASELYRRLAKIVRLASGVHFAAHSGAKRRCRIIHGHVQARMRLTAPLRDVRRRRRSLPPGSATTTRRAPFTPRLRVARTTDPRNNRIICPETEGSLEHREGNDRTDM